MKLLMSFKTCYNMVVVWSWGCNDKKLSYILKTLELKQQISSLPLSMN